jgi:hypothetical protein
VVPGWSRGGPGAGPCHTGRSHWLGGILHYCRTPGEEHGRAPFDLLAGFAQGPQGSVKCQCSLLAGFAQGLQSHAIRPRFATSKTRGCYPMRAPSRVICLPPTEVSEERDDRIESAALSLSRRMHLRLSVRGFQGARKAQIKLSRAHTAGENTHSKATRRSTSFDVAVAVVLKTGSFVGKCICSSCNEKLMCLLPPFYRRIILPSTTRVNATASPRFRARPGQLQLCVLCAVS